MVKTAQSVVFQFYPELTLVVCFSDDAILSLFFNFKDGDLIFSEKILVEPVQDFLVGRSIFQMFGQKIMQTG